MVYIDDRVAEDHVTRAENTKSPYEQLQLAIISGELKPGEPLVELALAKQMGVSRTPIREALIRLEQDALVVRGPYGLRVREITMEQILDLYDVRITLESKASAVAAERRNEVDLIRIRAEAGRAATAAADDPRGLAATNRAFHRAIAIASHNEFLLDLLDRMNLQLGRYPETTLAHPGRLEVANQQHTDLVEAIEQRDAERAAAVAEAHFTDARNIRLALYGMDVR